MIEKFSKLIENPNQFSPVEIQEIEEVSRLFEDHIEEFGVLYNIPKNVRERLYEQLLTHLEEAAMTQKATETGRVFASTLYASGVAFIQNYPATHIAEFTQAKQHAPEADFDGFIVALDPKSKPSFE